MAAPLIVYRYGDPGFTPEATLYNALHGEVTRISENRIVLDHPFGERLVIKGTFEVDNGTLIGGSVSGFNLYQDSTRIITGKNLTIDGGELKDALAQLETNGDVLSDLLWKGANLRGSEFGDELVTNSFNVTLLGRGGADRLYGAEGRQTLDGGDGNDMLIGYGARDFLIGGDGRDLFVFSDLNKSDKVLDFSHADDTLGFDANTFNALGKGFLKEFQFRVGTEATTSAHRFIYNDASGALYYDHDGFGGDPQVKVAVLSPGLDLRANDILVGEFIA